MAGEMSASEVTREAYPLHFAIADALGGDVRPFDQYQGPYVYIAGTGRLWIGSEDGAVLYVYNEGNDKKSFEFLQTYNDADDAHMVIDAAVEVTGLTVKRCPVCDKQESA